jgi:hypothetical protein
VGLEEAQVDDERYLIGVDLAAGTDRTALIAMRAFGVEAIGPSVAVAVFGGIVRNAERLLVRAARSPARSPHRRKHPALRRRATARAARRLG